MATKLTEKKKIQVSDIFTDNYYELVNLSKEYVLHLIIMILNESNIYNLVKSDFISVERIIRDLNFISKSERVIFWMLSYLYELGFSEMIIKNDTSYFKIRQDPPDINPEKITDMMLLIDKNVLPSNLLLARAAKGYLDFFQGKKTAIDILFTSDKMKLWTDYFNNDNSGYVVYNSFATLGLLKWLPHKENLRILELGGGTGSASVFFLKEMHKRGLIKIIKEYIFSDISPILLRVGNRALMEELHDDQMVHLKTLDFNKSFNSQGLKSNSLDIIWGVNSIHAADNLEMTLENIYDTLMPGGLIIMSECVRPQKHSFLFQELIFNLLDDYRDIQLSNLRPMPGFLDIESWQKILDKTKFENIEILTNINGRKQSLYEKRIFASIIKGEKKL